MLTAMACCPLLTGRAGHGSAAWWVTEASVSVLRWCREGAQVAEMRGAADPVASATILLVCLATVRPRRAQHAVRSGRCVA